MGSLPLNPDEAILPPPAARRNYRNSFARGINAVFEGLASLRLQNQYGPDWQQKLRAEQQEREDRLDANELALEQSRQAIADRLAKGVAEDLLGRSAMSAPPPETMKLGDYTVTLPKPGTDFNPEELVPAEAARLARTTPGAVVGRARGIVAESKRQRQELADMERRLRDEANRAFRAGQLDKAQQFSLVRDMIEEYLAQETGIVPGESYLKARRRYFPPRGTSPADLVGKESRTIEGLRNAASGALLDFQQGLIDESEFLRRIEESNREQIKLLGLAGTASGEESMRSAMKSAQGLVMDVLYQKASIAKKENNDDTLMKAWEARFRPQAAKPSLWQRLFGGGGAQPQPPTPTPTPTPSVGSIPPRPAAPAPAARPEDREVEVPPEIAALVAKVKGGGMLSEAERQLWTRWKQSMGIR